MRRSRDDDVDEEGIRGTGGSRREDRQVSVLAARVEELEAAVRVLTARVEQAEAMNTRLERTLYEVTRIHLSIAHMQQQEEAAQEDSSNNSSAAIMSAPVQLPRLTRPTQEPGQHVLLPPLLPPLQPAATAPFSEYVERQLARHGACLPAACSPSTRRAVATTSAIAESGAGEAVPVAQQRLPDSAVRQMKEWLHANMDHPYPTEADKRCLLPFSFLFPLCCFVMCCVFVV